MTRSIRYSLVCVVGVVAAVALALPLAAQETQAAQPVVSAPTMSTHDLFMLQRRGPGGDLANEGIGTALGIRGVTTACVIPPETCYECLFLDSYNSNDTYNKSVPGSEVINVAKTSHFLTLGQPYMITITGTFSYWSAPYYTAPAGNPESHPIFSSPTVPSASQGDVALDWEYIFATPVPAGIDFSSGPIHVVWAGISLDTGANFVDLVPMGGQAYSSTHSYSYLVEGKGAQASFMISDAGPHSDNYGRFKICIYKLKPITTCVD